MSRLDKLKELEEYLYNSMQVADAKNLAPLSKQYRDTLREIEEIEGTQDTEDEIGKLLSSRKADGKSDSVRKNSPRV